MDDNKGNNTIQTLWVLIGSLSAFGFSIVSSMILSRYFTKTDYGTYKQIMYVYTTLLGLFTLGLPKAYTFFLPRVSQSEAKNVINKINIILLISGAVLSSILYFGSDFIASTLKNEELSLPLKWFSVVPLFMLPTMGLEGILSTYKKTQLLALYNIITRVLMLICVITPILFFNGNVIHAVIGFAISSFLSFLLANYLKYHPLRKIYENMPSSVSYKDIVKYTQPIMLATLCGVVINATDQFFISRYFGNEVFADFANGSLELPFVSMIISAGGLVLAPIFSKQIYDNGIDATESIIQLWRSVFSKSIKLIYPLVVFFFCFGDVIMVLLYGQQYESSGTYFRIKLIVNFFTLAMYGPLLLSIGGNIFYFKVHFYGAILLILLELISVKTINSPLAITAISVICQIGRIFAMLGYISKYFKIKVIDLFPIKLIIELLLPSIIIIYLLKFIFEGFTLLQGISLIIVAGLGYIIILFLWIRYRKIDYYSIIKPLLQKILK